MSGKLEIKLIDAQPYYKARAKLCEVLSHGRKKLAFACAFLTEAGLACIAKHIGNLHLPDSFAVFSFEEPTSTKALAKLFSQYPDKIFVHYGTYLREYEPTFPRGIMHSKLFFASDGITTKVWCGSHNLTGSALQRKNIEAATLVEGPCDHSFFRDVEKHLDGCRLRSRNELRERISGSEGTTYVIEIEHEDVDLLLSSLKKNFFIRFVPIGTKEQPKLQPNRNYVIRLFNPGQLKKGFPGQKAVAVIRGKITALNLTDKNPAKGTKAKFDRIRHTIIESSPDHFVIENGDTAASKMVDAILRVSTFGTERTLFLSAAPRSQEEVDCCKSYLTKSPDFSEAEEQYSDVQEIEIDESLADADVSALFKTRKDSDFVLLGKQRFWISRWSAKLS